MRTLISVKNKDLLAAIRDFLGQLLAAGVVDALLSPAKNEAASLIFPETDIGNQQFCMFTLIDGLWQYTEPGSVSGRRVIYPQGGILLCPIFTQK